MWLLWVGAGDLEKARWWRGVCDDRGRGRRRDDGSMLFGWSGDGAAADENLRFRLLVE